MSDARNRNVAVASTPRLVKLGAALTAIAVFVLLAAPAGYASGVLPLLIALLAGLLLGLLAAIAGAAASLVGLVLVLRRPRAARRGAGLAAAALVAALAALAIPGRYLRDGATPPIHDITTDTGNPPQFVDVLPLRADAPNPAAYEGEAIASQQRTAYPEIRPLTVAAPPAVVFARALDVARDMGWTLVASDPAAGRIEATDTTFWFRFKDDVVVRLTPEGSGTRVDVRSLSRVGGGDVGTNARRIRTYLAALSAG